MAIHKRGDAGITSLVCRDPKKEEAVDPPTPAETSETAALREEIRRLERELAEAKAFQQTVLDHATSVVQLFEQAHKRLESLEQHMRELDQRLQQPPRREEEPSPASPARPLLHAKSYLPIRYIILEMLQEHPEGLTRKQLETAMGGTKSLEHVISHMKRDTLIVSKSLGVYVLPPSAHETA